MAALLLARPRLVQVACGTYKVDVPFQSYSSKVEKERRTVLPTDPGVKPFSAIPGPPSVPVIGNLWRFLTGQHELKKPYDMYSSYLKMYGPLVKEQLYYGRTLVHVFAPKDIEEVYKVEALKNPVRMSHRALGKYRASRKHLYEVPGVGVSNGREWAAYRGIFQFEFFRKTTAAAFEEIADDLMEYIKSNLDHNGEIPLLPTLYYYTLECVTALILGKRFGCFDKDRREPVASFIQAVHDTHHAVHRTELMPSFLTRKDYKVLEAAQDYMAYYVLHHIQYVTNMIENARLRNAEPGTEEHLALIDGEKRNRPIRPSESFIYQYLKRGISHSKLLPMAVDLFQAGVHSTAHTFAFALYHLALNPDKQLLFREELLKELPKKNDRVSDLHFVGTLGCCNDVIKETLRLNPPTIGTGRVLLQDLVLSGFLVPEGTCVILQHEVASKEESNFPQPLEFIPGRPSLRTYAYRPFAAGKRRCFGQGIANQELRIGLAKIMREFEVSYHHKKVGVKNYLINEPDGVIKLRFKESRLSKE